MSFCALHQSAQSRPEKGSISAIARAPGAFSSAMTSPFGETMKLPTSVPHPPQETTIYTKFSAARAKGSPADVGSAKGCPADCRVKDEIGAAEGQTAGGFGEDHIVADEHAHPAEIFSFKNWEFCTGLFARFLNGQHRFVISANLAAAPVEQKGGILNGLSFAPGICAQNQVHIVFSGRCPQLGHGALLDIREDLLHQRQVDGFPRGQAEHVFREGEHITSRFSGCVDERFEQVKGLVHVGEHILRCVQAVIGVDGSAYASAAVG